MKYQTETSNGYKFYERFSNFLISELLNEEIEDCNHDNGEFNFFYNCQNLDENNIDLKYPNDVDTTSIALSILYKRSLIDINIINNVVNKLLLDSNIIQVYFVNKDDKRYGLTDPIVCSNALYLICLINKDNLKLTKNYILKSLDTFESRYYVSFDSFLYFLSRTVSSFKHLEIDFGIILRKKIKERIGTVGNPIDIAMRKIASKMMGIENNEEYIDKPSPIYRYGKKNITLENKKLTEAFIKVSLNFKVN
jgi:hypothetical protein